MERKTRLNPISLVADLHCHTLASSHAYSTVTELAEAAARRGLLAVGCTDHGVAMPDSPHPWHFFNLDTLPDRIAGVRVLRGVEANVLDASGRLDMPEEILDKLELTVASMHGDTCKAMSKEACTAAWLAVAENPRVDIIGHSGAPQFAYDYETVIPAFGRGGKAVEINENTFLVRRSSLPNCRRIAALCKRYRVPVAVDSDAHYHGNVAQVPQSLALLREVDFPPELIINASKESMNAFFARRGILLE